MNTLNNAFAMLIILLAGLALMGWIPPRCCWVNPSKAGATI